MEDWEKELIPVGTAVPPEDDWEASLEPVTPPAAAPEVPPAKEFSNMGQGEAAMIGLRSGATKGWDARFGAWLQEQLAKASEAAPRLPPGNWTGIENYPEGDVAEDIYDDALQSNFREYDAAVEQHPKTVGATELVGDIGSDLAIAAGTGGVNLTPAGQALTGALEGAGRSRSDLLSGETALNVGVGAGLGGAFGALGRRVGPKKAMVAGAGLGEGLGALFGESDEEATKRRTQSLLGAGTGLSSGAAGWLRNRLAKPFKDRAAKAMDELNQGLDERDLDSNLATREAQRQFVEAANKTGAKHKGAIDSVEEKNRAALTDYERKSQEDAAKHFDAVVRSIQGGTDSANKVRTKALTAADEDHQKALGKFSKDREEALPAVEKASDDTVEANLKALAKAAAERKKVLDEKLTVEGKKRIEGEKQAEKALVQAYMTEQAAKRVKAKLDAGEEPDAADLHAISDSGNIDARALGILGNKVQEAFRYLRSQPALEPHGFSLDPTAKKGLSAVLPDYAAKGNKKLGEFAEGKGAVLEKIKAELAAEDPAAVGKGRAAAKGGGDGEFSDEITYMDPEHLARAMPDPVDPKTKVPDDVRARLEAEVPETIPPLEHLPANPRKAGAGALLASPPEKVQPDLESLPGAQPEFDIPAPPAPRPRPQLERPPATVPAQGSAPEFLTDVNKPRMTREQEVADQLQRAKDLAKADGVTGAVRAAVNPGGLVRGGAMAIGGGLLGGIPGAVAGYGASIPISAGANIRGNATKFDRATLGYSNPAYAHVMHDKIARVLAGNPEFRNRLQTFLNADNADILAARVNYLLENVPEFAAAWSEADEP